MWYEEDREIITRTVRSIAETYWGEEVAKKSKVDYELDDNNNPDWYFKHSETNEVYEVSISRSGIIKIVGMPDNTPWYADY
jgi:hypothetical protein